jgi:hypothetical protein
MIPQFGMVEAETMAETQPSGTVVEEIREILPSGTVAEETMAAETMVETQPSGMVAEAIRVTHYQMETNFAMK